MRRWFILFSIMTSLCLVPETDRAARASQPIDLCEIPFTEAHRAAIEERHFPALREIWDYWLNEAPAEVVFASFPKRMGKDDLERLGSFENAIKSAEVQSDHLGQSDRLPPRQGPAIPPESFRPTDGPTYLILDDAQQKALDDAMQALLHWACGIRDFDLFSGLVFFVINYREDLAGRSSGYVLSYADWRQLMTLAYRRIPIRRR